MERWHSSLVKNSSWSKGLRFNSQHTHGSSQLSVTSVLGDLTPSHGHTSRWSLYVCKNKRNTKKKIKHLDYLGQEWTGKQDTHIMFRGEHTLTVQTRK